ncbi:GPP34 family phosphoprotein [Streptomyces ovatisporus]|uniref:GPP34 family phosphoprotein n=1 Tax=Streptomyces ovatisporus TaxID=1128682 RepID=A0ABV9AB36_9ACTN
MAATQPQLLSLPEEFVLLSHLPSGKIHGPRRAAVGCAAAELGELAVRRKILVRPWNSTVLGLRAQLTHRASIELLDTTATGLPWADEVLAGLSRSPVSEEGRVNVQQWLRRRREAFRAHRRVLTDRGVLRRRSRCLTGERCLPDQAVRDALITDIRAIGSGHRDVDAHGLFLCDLIRAVGLHRTLRIPTGLRTTPYRRRGAGSAESVPEDLRHASSALTALIPLREDRSGKRYL